MSWNTLGSDGTYTAHSSFCGCKQKSAYEMRISDWIQTCALPISAAWGSDEARGFSDIPRPAAHAPRRAPVTRTVPPSPGPLRHFVALIFRAGSSGRSSMRRQSSPAQLRSEEHTSELQSLMRISYAVLCLKKNTLT